MSAIAVASIASVGLGAYKAIDGANQKADAKRLAKNNVFQPERMPGEIQTATNIAAQNYYNGMPGMAHAESALQNNAANSYYNASQGASSGGDLLDLASRIGAGTNIATSDLAARGAAYKANASGEYQRALNNQGDWQNRLYQNNELQPYLRTANTAASMYGAGQENMYGGLDDIALSGSNYASTLNKNTSTTATGQPISNSPYATPLVNNAYTKPAVKTYPVGTGWQNYAF